MWCIPFKVTSHVPRQDKYDCLKIYLLSVLFVRGVNFKTLFSCLSGKLANFSFSVIVILEALCKRAAGRLEKAERRKKCRARLTVLNLPNFNFFASTVGFNTEDSCFQSQEFEKLIKDVLLRSILSFGVWQVYHEQLRGNNRVIFFDFFFSKSCWKCWGAAYLRVRFFTENC